MGDLTPHLPVPNVADSNLFDSHGTVIILTGLLLVFFGATVYLDDFTRLLLETLALPEGVLLYATTEDGLIAFHPDPTLLLEEASQIDVEGMVAVEARWDLLGWTFVAASAP